MKAALTCILLAYDLYCMKIKTEIKSEAIPSLIAPKLEYLINDDMKSTLKRGASLLITIDNTIKLVTERYNSLTS